MLIEVEISLDQTRITLEVPDNATDEFIENMISNLAPEQLNWQWEKFPDEEPLTDENRPELTIKERNK